MGHLVAIDDPEKWAKMADPSSGRESKLCAFVPLSA
jgi:hypothetical protein